MVERAGFENRYTLTGIQGSNPCLSVIKPAAGPRSRCGALLSDPGWTTLGEVSEWPKEYAWKAYIRVTVSRVRIPPSPLRAPRTCGARVIFRPPVVL